MIQCKIENLVIEDLNIRLKKQTINKNKILRKNIKTIEKKEYEEYLEVYLTYKVLENTETYEKIEF